MTDSYVIDIISNIEKKIYKQVALSAINSLRSKIVDLQQMVTDNAAMPPMKEPSQVAFYIKDAIGISNRESQSGLTSGATNESYYIRFIPINKQDIVIDLRITDHIRGEEWSDRKDNGEHPNLRASAIVQDTSGTTPTIAPKKPHITNGIKIKRVVQHIPTMLYGTSEQVISHLNTLICLFQNGHFGKYKVKKKEPLESKDRIPQNISVDKDGNYVPANGHGADYVSENKQYKTNTNMKQKFRITESDLHRIVKESVNRILLKEFDVNQEEYYETKRDELINKVTTYLKEIETMLDQFRNEFGDESIEDDEYLTDLDKSVNQLKFGY